MSRERAGAAKEGSTLRDPALIAVDRTGYAVGSNFHLSTLAFSHGSFPVSQLLVPYDELSWKLSTSGRAQCIEPCLPASSDSQERVTVRALAII